MTGAALPFHNGVSAWWAALRALDPRLTYAYVMGMTGGVARTVVCSNECLCREWREVEIAQRAAVEAMGYRVRPLDAVKISDERLGAALARSIDHGVPVPWFLVDREGVLIAHHAGERSFLARVVTASGEQREEVLALSDLRRAQVFRLTRSSRPKGLRSRRESLALAEWTAYALRPPLAGGCITLPPPAWNAVGLAAYALWADLLEREQELSPEKQIVIRQRARWWLDARRASVEFLRELAGKQRAPYAARLRRAADLFEQETGVLSMLERGFSTGQFKIQNPTSKILRAAGLAARAMERVGEAALLRMRLAPEAHEALLEPPEAPLHPIAFQEILYLARAGIRPLRQLAARRLAGSDSPQAVATLTQLLYDPDGPTSETALWALQQIAPKESRRLFADAFRHVPRDRRNTDQPLQRALLFAVAETPDEDARRLLREALDDTGEGDRDPGAVRDWAAALLYERYPDRSAAQFRDALESGSPTAQEVAARYLAKIEAESGSRTDL